MSKTELFQTEGDLLQPLETICYGGEDKQEAPLEPMVMWKVLEAFLGKNRAWPQSRLVAIDLGLLFSKLSSWVLICAGLF